MLKNHTLLNWLEDYWPIAAGLIIFGLVLWFTSYDNAKTLFSSLDTASSIALAVLAFGGYWQYSKEKAKKRHFIKRLENLECQEDGSKQLAVAIQFGSKNGDLIPQLKQAALEKVKNEDWVIVSPPFGDKDHQLDRDDMLALIEFAAEIKNTIARTQAQKVHIFYAGLTVGGMALVDILNNSAELLIYHFEKGQYLLWHTDSKHRPKQAKTLKDAQF